MINNREAEASAAAAEEERRRAEQEERRRQEEERRVREAEKRALRQLERKYALRLEGGVEAGKPAKVGSCHGLPNCMCACIVLCVKCVLPPIGTQKN